MTREQGGELPAATRERLVTSALSEVVGLGLIDRLWSDRTVRAILVNGPSSVFVDRDGTLQAVSEGFRGEAHLLELIGRLVGRPASGMADLRLRLGARSRLDMMVTGPSGSGKTALLAAMARDLDADSRVVTVARHRQFRWPAASKVELVTSPAASFSALIEAGARLEPGLLLLDAIQPEDVAALSGRLLRGEPGTLASLRPDAMSAALARLADLVVSIDRCGGGPFRVMAMEDSGGGAVFRYDGSKLVRGTGSPAFAATVRARGHGDALIQLLN